ncbi:DUF1467 family protein [Croceicoccus pelagius]|uniref:DUF1467 domain-containing protein n=1 Tax=Croceicoccus pelagius TaxID=1703341 RepID=A0A916YHT6_9SPHN|nr:DUF1467 family protein [Croceicoccus pelagius]GGD46221.1 hypothetical protein GCM10010989_20560 [Croceicoccus pelagius]
MQWTSVLAIYLLFWVMSAFIVMPFGIRTHREAGEELVPGQADSAPSNFRPGRVAIRATILAAILCALFYANYVNGWITVADLNFIHPPKEIVEEQIWMRETAKD